MAKKSWKIRILRQRKVEIWWQTWLRSCFFLCMLFHTKLCLLLHGYVLLSFCQVIIKEQLATQNFRRDKMSQVDFISQMWKNCYFKVLNRLCIVDLLAIHTWFVLLYWTQVCFRSKNFYVLNTSIHVWHEHNFLQSLCFGIILYFGNDIKLFNWCCMLVCFSSPVLVTHRNDFCHQCI